jgi:hypothetical protein
MSALIEAIREAENAQRGAVEEIDGRNRLKGLFQPAERVTPNQLVWAIVLLSSVFAMFATMSYVQHDRLTTIIAYQQDIINSRINRLSVQINERLGRSELLGDLLSKNLTHLIEDLRIEKLQQQGTLDNRLFTG